MHTLKNHHWMIKLIYSPFVYGAFVKHYILVSAALSTPAFVTEA